MIDDQKVCGPFVYSVITPIQEIRGIPPDKEDTRYRLIFCHVFGLVIYMYIYFYGRNNTMYIEVLKDLKN